MNLGGLRVVLTRPIGQNETLAAAIRAHGGEALLFPVLEIQEVIDPAPLEAAIAGLAGYHLAVFISPNAVHRALPRSQAAWPERLAAAAIGPAGAQALRGYGVKDVLVPEERYDSESLLALPELRNMRGKRVIIFRGQGGRELLGSTLRDRGAAVDYVECYRRVVPASDARALREAGAKGEVDAIVITSSEGLRNLHAMLGPTALIWLLRTPLFLPHARIAQQARDLGHLQIVATPAGDAGLLSALGEFSDRVRPPSEQGGISSSKQS